MLKILKNAQAIHETFVYVFTFAFVKIVWSSFTVCFPQFSQMVQITGQQNSFFSVVLDMSQQIIFIFSAGLMKSLYNHLNYDVNN